MLTKAAGHMSKKNDSVGEELFGEFLEGAKNSIIKKGCVEYWYEIAGHKIQFKFAGSAMVPKIVPALAHMQRAIPHNAEEADLTVWLWDSVSTEVDPPPCTWDGEGFMDAWLHRQYDHDNIVTVTFNVNSGILNLYNHQERTAIFWTKDAEAIPYFETGAPLRNIFALWAAEKGFQLAHAAVVGTESGALLIAGKGGAGKSTSALSTLLYSDLKYLGDDYILIGNDAQKTVYTLYTSAKLHATHIKNLPDLESMVSNKDRLDTEKALIFVNEYHPKKILRSLPTKAIVLPTVWNNSESRLVRTSSAHALRALAPSSIFQLPGRIKGTFSFFGSFVKEVPAYTLYAGNDLRNLPKRLLEITD